MAARSFWLDNVVPAWRRFVKTIISPFQQLDHDSVYRLWKLSAYILLVLNFSGYELAHRWHAVGEALQMIGLPDLASPLPANYRPLIAWLCVAYFGNAFWINVIMMLHDRQQVE